MQGVQQVPTGMIALRSVPVQMVESVNWMDLADALKGLLDPTAQSKVLISNGIIIGLSDSIDCEIAS